MRFRIAVVAGRQVRNRKLALRIGNNGSLAACLDVLDREMEAPDTGFREASVTWPAMVPFTDWALAPADRKTDMKKTARMFKTILTRRILYYN